MPSGLIDLVLPYEALALKKFTARSWGVKDNS